MILLKLEHVSKSHRHGAREQIALQDVTLELHAGELVGIWGLRDCGRSTLLRIAAGIEQPDEGRVYLDGHELDGQPEALGGQIGYCHPLLTGPRSLRHGASAIPVISALIMAQLARGVPTSKARERALEALSRTDARGCATMHPAEMNGAEATRVMIAQALTSSPELLLINEPTRSVELLERDPILRLLRSLADDGIGVLISVDESTGLYGSDRALSFDEGELRGPAIPTLAPIISLSQRLSA